MMMRMFVPHVMILWFREYNGVCGHVDIKIGCNDDLHDCLNKSATLLHNKAFFCLAWYLFTLNDIKRPLNEYTCIINSAFIGSTLYFLPASIHWAFFNWKLGKCSLSALPTEEWLPTRKLNYRSEPCILLAFHTSGLWESNGKYFGLFLLLTLKEWGSWAQEV